MFKLGWFLGPYGLEPRVLGLVLVPSLTFGVTSQSVAFQDLFSVPVLSASQSWEDAIR